METQRNRVVVQPCQRATVKAVEDLIGILRSTNTGPSSEAHLRADISWLLRTPDRDTDQIGALFEVLQYIVVFTVASAIVSVDN